MADTCMCISHSSWPRRYHPAAASARRRHGYDMDRSRRANRFVNNRILFVPADIDSGSSLASPAIRDHQCIGRSDGTGSSRKDVNGIVDQSPRADRDREIRPLCSRTRHFRMVCSHTNSGESRRTHRSIRPDTRKSACGRMSQYMFHRFDSSTKRYSCRFLPRRIRRQTVSGIHIRQPNCLFDCICRHFGMDAMHTDSIGAHNANLK